jgi:hypothetical protein
MRAPLRFRIDRDVEGDAAARPVHFGIGVRRRDNAAGDYDWAGEEQRERGFHD